jgi:UDP-N-acetylglucosamine 2-epimerase
MKILVCYGTRPEYIKIKPLLDEFKKSNIKFNTLNIRQHENLVKDEADFTVFLREQSISRNRLDLILSTIADIDDGCFCGVTHVLVQGDTATALLCAMASFHRQIPVIHLEAGLRTKDFENPYPEEGYRQLISRIASIHLCPTENNKDNLLKENINGKIYVVGNTVLDNLVKFKDMSSYNDEVLITLHRRENHSNMQNWFKALSTIAMSNPDIRYTIPIHPNPNVLKHKDELQGLNIIDPMPYDEFLKRFVSCRYLITDSGGIQEEASFLGKKVIVCRKVTERPESIGINTIMCDSPEDLIKKESLVRDNYFVEQNTIYGDGNSCSNISRILNNLKIN